MAEFEINDALASELDELREAYAAGIAALAQPEVDGAPARERAEALAEIVRRFTAAAEFCEMSGLRALASRMEDALRSLAFVTSDHRPGLIERGHFAAWPGELATFLRDPSATASLGRALRPLGLPELALPMEAEAVQALHERLLVECTSGAPADAGAGGVQGRADDLDLSFAADINPELADTFLVEAPQQAARLASIVHLLAEHGFAEDRIGQARRLAHTLKGSANITGVRAIASLTHHAEEVLGAVLERGELPAGELPALLLETVDCLEAMLESLAQRRPCPVQAASLVEGLARWTTYLREEAPARPQATSRTTPAPAPVPPRGAEATGSDAPPTTGETGTNAVRVAVGSVDRLLGLAGELSIANVQMHGRLRRALAQLSLQREQQQLMETRLTALQELVNVRGVPASRRPAAGGTEVFDPLELDEYNELHSAVNAFAESLTDLGEIEIGLSAELRELERSLVRQEQSTRDLSDLVLAVRMVPVATIVPRLARVVRQTARSTGKRARLRVEGAELSLDSEILDRIADPLMHMLRNAIDHGIEPPDVRTEAGKDAEGEVVLELAREGDSVLIVCRDDGAGFDETEVRSVAVERGLVSAEQQLSPRETLRLTLLPGFSTRREITQISGRGIGMDVVHKAVSDLRGSIDIASSRGAGTAISMRLPLTLVSLHVLLVRAGSLILGIPSSLLSQVLFSDSGRLEAGDEAGEPGLRFVLDDVAYDVVTIHRLLGIAPEPDPWQEASPVPLLLLAGGARPTAVVVDEALDGRYLVVKRLGEYVPRVRAVIGASFLQDGSVAPVLDLLELVREPARPLSQLATSPRPDARASVPDVLVVDDSLSARRTLCELVSDAGYTVRGAVDGLDAIQAIEQRMPDLVLVDLEMPNMNGIELANHLRASPRTRDLPLVMVTSRSTRKHHDQAFAAGVERVITKPWHEDELLAAIERAVARGRHAVRV
ncbi:MAG: response regulator [Ectothiorhodospiraceae bacterium]|nr:response regulator [Chromatiales bacterium]MCP5157478.1 response regulator [Ectothiorhodospiraceae bacterium]